MLLDLDHFKAINDTHGHGAGDAVLEKVSSIIKDSMRVADLSCRYGGEEFCVLLPETDLKQTMGLAERLRNDIAAALINYQDKRLSVSVSIGVALWQQADEVDEILEKADKALYRAKNDGRNCVRVVNQLSKDSA